MNQLINSVLPRLAKAGMVFTDIKVVVDLTERAVYKADHNGQVCYVKVDINSRRLAGETLALRTCQQGMVPVPRIIYHDPKKPSILVTSAVEGNVLSGVSSHATWQSVGFRLAQLHQVVPLPDMGQNVAYPGWSKLITQFTGQSARGIKQVQSALGPGSWDRLKKLLETSLSDAGRTQYTLIQGDCQPDHFICRNDEVAGIIDFGDAGIGDPIWDIAVLTLYCPDQREPLLEGYQPSQERAKKIQIRLRPYWIVRCLGEVVWLESKHLNYDRPLSRLKELINIVI